MTKAKDLESWRIDLISQVPRIDGFVNGKRIQNDVIYYFNPDEMVIMTEKEIFNLKNPDAFWMKNVLDSGLSIEDFEMNSTSH
jgi:hypothetical protein